MKKLIALTLSIVMILSLFAGCGTNVKPAATPAASGNAANGNAASTDAKLVLRGCTQNPDSNITTLVTKHFAQRVNELSNGTIQMDVYINAEFGSEQSVMEQVMTGTLDFAPISTAVMANVVPACGIYTLPFMFPDMYVYEDVVTDPDFQEAVFSAVNAQTGAVALGNIHALGRGLATTGKQVKTLADIKGLKVRTIGSTIINDCFEALGATVTTVAWKEVYTALQQGLVDGDDSTVNSQLNMKFIEYNKYFIELNEMFQDALIVIGAPTWAKLTAEQQEIMRQAAKDATAWGMDYTAQYRQEGFDQVAKEYDYFTIIPREEIPEADYAEFYKAGTSIWPKYTKDIGEDLVNMTVELVEKYSAE